MKIPPPPLRQRWKDTICLGLKGTFRIPPPPPQAEVRRYKLPEFKKNIWDSPSPHRQRWEGANCPSWKRTFERSPPPLHKIGGEKVRGRPGQKEHLEEGGKVEKVQLWPGLKRTFSFMQMMLSVRNKRFARKRLLLQGCYKRAANCNRCRFLSDSHRVPLCCSPSFIALPRKPLTQKSISPIVPEL